MTVRNHLDEIALAQMLDDQLDDRDRDHWQSHVDECDQCRAALTNLSTQAVSLKTMLMETDAPVPAMVLPVARPSRMRRIPILRYATAAMAAGVLFVVVIAPVRAWVVDQVAELGVRFLGVERSADNAVPAPAPAALPNRMAVSVPITGNVLRVRISNRQSAGRLFVTAANTLSASAEVEGGGGERIVLSDGLVIENDEMSTANYRVVVPVNLAIEVFVDDEPVSVFTFADVNGSREFQLGPR